MVQVVVVVAVGGTGLGVGMHIDGAGRRLLKLIPHQSFYKRAVGQVQRRLRIYIYLYDISYYIEWSGVARPVVELKSRGLLKKVTHAHWF